MREIKAPSLQVFSLPEMGRGVDCEATQSAELELMRVKKKKVIQKKKKEEAVQKGKH